MIGIPSKIHLQHTDPEFDQANNLFERRKLSGPDKVEVRVRFWMRKRARLRFDSGQCECLTVGNFIKGCGECQGNNKKPEQYIVRAY